MIFGWLSARGFRGEVRNDTTEKRCESREVSNFPIHLFQNVEKNHVNSKHDGPLPLRCPGKEVNGSMVIGSVGYFT